MYYSCNHEFVFSSAKQNHDTSMLLFFSCFAVSSIPASGTGLIRLLELLELGRDLLIRFLHDLDDAFRPPRVLVVHGAQDRQRGTWRCAS